MWHRAWDLHGNNILSLDKGICEVNLKVRFCCENCKTASFYLFSRKSPLLYIFVNVFGQRINTMWVVSFWISNVSFYHPTLIQAYQPGSAALCSTPTWWPQIGTTWPWISQRKLFCIQPTTKKVKICSSWTTGAWYLTTQAFIQR